MTSVIDWTLLERLVQWVIIPAIAWVWSIQRSVSDSDKRISQLFSENLRILTILEERQKGGDEYKVNMAEALRDLRSVIKSLDDKLDHIGGAR